MKDYRIRFRIFPYTDFLLPYMVTFSPYTEISVYLRIETIFILLKGREKSLNILQDIIGNEFDGESYYTNKLKHYMKFTIGKDSFPGNAIEAAATFA